MDRALSPERRGTAEAPVHRRLSMTLKIEVEIPDSAADNVVRPVLAQPFPLRRRAGALRGRGRDTGWRCLVLTMQLGDLGRINTYGVIATPSNAIRGNTSDERIPLRNRTRALDGQMAAVSATWQMSCPRTVRKG